MSLGVSDAASEREAARESVRRSATAEGFRWARLSPTALVASLTAAALAPVVAPVLGVGTVGVAVAGLVGSTGHNYLADFATDFVKRRRASLKRGAGGAAEDLDRALAEGLLGSSPASLALRREASMLLQRIGAVDVALEAASADLRTALAEGLGQVGTTLHEFGWVLDDIQKSLVEIQETQALQLGIQKTQLEVSRRTLVATNLLLRQRHVSQNRGAQIAEGVSGDFRSNGQTASPPYQGLAAFQAEDDGQFFGREALVAALLARLVEAPFLAVVGPSGSGKSSLVRAGLVPAIWTGALPASHACREAIVLTPGRHPLQELALRVATLAGIPAGALLDDLRADPSRLTLAIRQTLAGGEDGTKVAIVVDQFEEMFTIARDEGEARRAIDALVAAATDEAHAALVVVVMRADFYGRCGAYPSLASAVEDSQVLVGPMTEAELRRAIELPAERAGLALQAGLADTMIADVRGQPGGLPLLSHALLETWKRRDGNTLTARGYAEAGGVRHAIAQTADAVFRDKLDSEQRILARGVFLRLTRLNDGADHTRRRASRNELAARPEDSPAVEEVLRILTDARLITTNGDSVELAHEALLREWPTLRRWVEEDRAGLVVHQRLAEDARDWVGHGYDRSLLYREANLLRAREWAKRRPTDLNELEREFLRASERREGRARQRRRGLIAGLCVLSLVAVGAAIYALIKQRDAQNQSRLATSGALAAQALSQMHGHLDQALLMSLEAYRRAHTLPARKSIFTGLLRSARITQFTHATQGLESVALSPDGRTMALATGRSVVLQDAATGHALGAPLGGHSARVITVAFSSDGTQLESADANGVVARWDVRARTARIGRVPGFDSWALALSPDGKTVAATTDNGRVMLWNLDAGLKIHGPLRMDTPASALAFDASGKVVAVASSFGNLGVYSVRTGHPLRRPWRASRERPLALAFSSDGRRLASGGGDQSVATWSIPSGDSRGVEREHTGPVTALAYNHQGNLLASGVKDHENSPGVITGIPHL